MALRRLLARAHIRDVLKGDIDRADDDRELIAFHAAAHIFFYTLPGGGSTNSRLDLYYVIALHVDWI